MDMDKVFDLIGAEREAQDVKWGDQSGHTLERWVTILFEEAGEAAKAVLEEDVEGLRLELVQVAAVAVAVLEALEPNSGPKAVRVLPYGESGCIPANRTDCPYRGDVACWSGSGDSGCGSCCGGYNGGDYVLCSG